MELRPNADDAPFSDDQSGLSGSLVAVPAVFWAHLGPEQFLAQQQIYRTAYEKACRKLTDESSTDEFSFDI